MAKVTKEMDVEVECEIALVRNGYCFDNFRLGQFELLDFEEVLVVGLKPGEKRTVHLVMTWEDSDEG